MNHKNTAGYSKAGKSSGVAGPSQLPQTPTGRAVRGGAINGQLVSFLVLQPLKCRKMGKKR